MRSAIEAAYAARNEPVPDWLDKMDIDHWTELQQCFGIAEIDDEFEIVNTDFIQWWNNYQYQMPKMAANYLQQLLKSKF